MDCCCCCLEMLQREKWDMARWQSPRGAGAKFPDELGKIEHKKVFVFMATLFFSCAHRLYRLQLLSLNTPNNIFYTCSHRVNTLLFQFLLKWLLLQDIHTCPKHKVAHFTADKQKSTWQNTWNCLECVVGRSAATLCRNHRGGRRFCS